jgi:stage II sporulation protein M
MLGYYNHPYMHDAVWISISLLCLSISIGYFVISAAPALESYIGSPEEKALLYEEGTPAWIYCLDIYLNNLKISLIAFLGGLLLGIGPVLIILMNGTFLGISFRYLAEQGAAFLLSILPHLGIELAGFIIASALGMMAGQKSWDFILKRPDKNITLKSLVITFLIYSNSLLILGAIIETYVSAFFSRVIVQ